MAQEQETQTTKTENNPYVDPDLMQKVQNDFTPTKCKQFEADHNVKTTTNDVKDANADNKTADDENENEVKDEDEVEDEVEDEEDTNIEDNVDKEEKEEKEVILDDTATPTRYVLNVRYQNVLQKMNNRKSTTKISNNGIEALNRKLAARRKKRLERLR